METQETTRDMMDNETGIKRVSDYQSLYDKMSETDRMLLRQISKNSIFEPFEGRKSLETMKKSITGIEKGLIKVKDSSVKAGNWLTRSKLVTQSKDKFTQLVDEFKIKSGNGHVGDLFEKIGGITEEIQRSTKEKYEDIEERTKRLSLSLIRKAFELVVSDDIEEWALSSSKAILKNNSFESFADLKKLDYNSRNRLIQELYPYQSVSFQKLMSAFNVSLNVGLGAVVATNLPGTGPAVSFVNMGKTAIKIGNRLNTMSALFGEKINNSQSLFQVSANLLKSLSDWENNESHLPVSSEIIGRLYTDEAEDEADAFKSLLSEIVRKDAYIAIPGVGTISLGKINLDDMKLDLSIQHITQTYHYKKELAQKYDLKTIERLIGIFSEVYRQFKVERYFDKVRKMKETAALNKDVTKWRTQLKLISGFDLAITESSVMLDQMAKIIGEIAVRETDDRRLSVIRRHVTSYLENPFKSLTDNS